MARERGEDLGSTLVATIRVNVFAWREWMYSREWSEWVKLSPVITKWMCEWTKQAFLLQRRPWMKRKSVNHSPVNREKWLVATKGSTTFACLVLWRFAWGESALFNVAPRDTLRVVSTPPRCCDTPLGQRTREHQRGVRNVLFITNSGEHVSAEWNWGDFSGGCCGFCDEFSAKTDGFCEGFCGGFLVLCFLKEKTDFGTGRKKGKHNLVWKSTGKSTIKSTPSSRWNMLPTL